MQRTETDHEHLTRAIELAERGVGSVSPNPVVGAVVVKDDRVLGEGWHEEYGGPHAEVNAIASAGDADLRGATLYVSLEPCCHQGQQPPCTDAILAAGIGRVVVASDDPTEKASGRGLGILRDEGVRGRPRRRRARRAGAPAEPGLPQARPHRAPVGALQVRDDASTARSRPRRATRSGSPARPAALVAHRWRASCDAVAVGIGTALADDPQLTARIDGVRRQPRRVVFDATGRLPLDSQLVSAAHEVPLVVVVSRAARRSNTDALENAGAEVIVATGENEPARVRSALDQLGALDRRSPRCCSRAARTWPARSSTRARSTRSASSSRRCCSAGARRATRSRARASTQISDALRALTLDCDKVAGDVLLSARLREW